MDITAPAVPGYELVVGADFGGKYDYPCSQSASEGLCKLYAPVEVGGRSAVHSAGRATRASLPYGRRGGAAVELGCCGRRAIGAWASYFGK